MNCLTHLITQSICYNEELVSHPTLEELSEVLECAKIITFQLVDFLQRFISYGMANNNYPRGRLTNNFGGKNQRVNRVRPMLDEPPLSPLSPQYTPEPFSPIGILSSPTRVVQPMVRPCASVPPSRIIRAPGVALSPTLTMAPPPLISQTSEMGSGDNNQNHPNAIKTIPVSVLVTSTAAPTLLPNPTPIGTPLLTSNPTVPLPTLSSEEDQLIPFSDRPFVSKYGPISRLMNLINTPTMTAPGNTISQQMITTGASTHPTNMILGRSAVPSLTLIQPLQILTATAFLTDPTSNSQYGRTFIAEPTYQNTYVSGLIEGGDNQMNQMNGSSVS